MWSFLTHNVQHWHRLSNSSIKTVFPMNDFGLCLSSVLPKAMSVFNSMSSRVSHHGRNTFSASVRSKRDRFTSPSKAIEPIIIVLPVLSSSSIPFFCFSPVFDQISGTVAVAVSSDVETAMKHGSLSILHRGGKRVRRAGVTRGSHLDRLAAGTINGCCCC